jgi:hypothetical protein
MVDLKERFQELDQVPAPDLGRVIEVRARHLASVPGALGSDLDAIGGRRFRVSPTQLLAAAAIVILGVGVAVIIHQARSTAPIRHGPTPTPPQGQVIPFKGIWPETSLEDAQYAQQRADSGDAAYNWQVDSGQDTHVPQRFLQEQLGWARAAYVGTSYDPPDHSGQDYEAKAVYFYFVECGPSGINPLYPHVAPAQSAPSVGGPLLSDGAHCAPTIDKTHYHTVKVRTEQPARRGRTGIWVVTEYQDDQPYVQTPPPSEADVRGLMEAFLAARVAGTGAETYVGSIGSDTAVHLDLYTTSSGSRYQQFEITSLSGPEWPLGTFRLLVLLTAQDGTSVEESTYIIDAESVRKGVVNAFYFRARATARP